MNDFLPAMDIGRVCLKVQGRESGQRCVVIDVIDRNYVIVTGPSVKRRRETPQMKKSSVFSDKYPPFFLLVLHSRERLLVSVKKGLIYTDVMCLACKYSFGD